MRIGLVGLGKLGLPVALAINFRGHEVCGYDTNPSVKKYLEDGAIPYRELGAPELLSHHTVTWRDSIADVVSDSDIVFIPIQTPHQVEYEGDDILPEGRADFSYEHLVAGLTAVSQACLELKKSTIVAVISTCLPGTFERELRPLLNDYTDYAYTPQFISMGNVIEDYLYPEFNLIGVDNAEAAATLEDFYATINDAPSVKTDVTTAEGVKVSYNTIISAKTVIANAWGELSERMGMDFDAINLAWSLSDRRLMSPAYFDAGMSDGGGCHPRDNIAMSWLADQVEMSHNLWDDLMQARQDYECWHASVAMDAMDQHDLPLVLLGRAFKPETDIETGSAAILVANILRREGVQFLHVNDLGYLPPAVYFICTQNEPYQGYDFPPGSVVLDPFGYIPDRDGVEVVRMGRR